METGKMVQWEEHLFAEVSGSVPSIHMVPHNHACKWDTYIYTGKTLIHINK